MGNSVNSQKLLKSSRDQRMNPNSKQTEKILCVFVDHPYLEDDIAVPVLAPVMESSLMKRRSEKASPAIQFRSLEGKQPSSHKPSPLQGSHTSPKLVRTESQILRTLGDKSTPPISKIQVIQDFNRTPSNPSQQNHSKILKKLKEIV